MTSNLSDPAFWSRFQFGFTLTYHYLFPQLTMGLAWFLVYWKWRALRTGNEEYNKAARFWAKIFGLNFAVGVVTGIPMEFQFGTRTFPICRRRNWTDAGDERYVCILLEVTPIPKYLQQHHPRRFYPLSYRPRQSPLKNIKERIQNCMST